MTRIAVVASYVLVGGAVLGVATAIVRENYLAAAWAALAAGEALIIASLARTGGRLSRAIGGLAILMESEYQRRDREGGGGRHAGGGG